MAASSDALLDALHIVASNFGSYSDMNDVLELTKSYFESPTIFRDILKSQRDHKNRSHLVRTVRNGNILWAKKVLQLLDITTTDSLVSNEFKGKECYICYEPFEENAIVYKLPCGGNHIFHKSCICRWVQYNSTCPYCRGPIEISDITTILNASSETEKNMLYYAIKKGDLPFVQDLIEKGAEIQYNGASPLHLAAGFSHPEMIQYFLNSGIFIDIPDRYGHTPLYYAARYCHKEEVFKTLLDASANHRFHFYDDINDRSEDTSLLHIAIGSGVSSSEWIINYYTSKGLSLDELDKTGQTPLTVATNLYNLRRVKQLVENGASLGGTFQADKHPLYTSMNQSYDDDEQETCFHYLLNTMDSLYLETEERETYLMFLYNAAALSLAKKSDKISPLKILKKPEVIIDSSLYYLLAQLSVKDIETIGKYETYLFHPGFFIECVKANNTQLIQFLIKTNPNFDINAQDAEGNTAAFVTKKTTMLELLDTHKINWNLQNNKGQTPLHLIFGDYDLSGNDICFKPKSNHTTFTIKEFTLTKRVVERPTQEESATRSRRYVISRRRFNLLMDDEEEVEEDEEDQDFMPPPRPIKKVVAAKQKYDWNPEELVPFLLEKGVDMNVPDTKGVTILHLAVQNAHIDILNSLFEKGIQPRTYWISPLELALKKEHIQLALLLIEKGADIHITYEGLPLMHYAFKNYYPDLIQILIKKGVSCNARDTQGNTPLFYFLQTYSNAGDRYITKLAELGTDLNLAYHLQKEGPNTVLQYAASKGNFILVKTLVELGANINIQDQQGRTALHHASRGGNPDVLLYLLGQNSRLDVYDIENRNPLSYIPDAESVDSDEAYEEERKNNEWNNELFNESDWEDFWHRPDDEDEEIVQSSFDEYEMVEE